MRYIIIFIIINCIIKSKCDNDDDYSEKRAKILTMEASLRLGGNTTLSQKEITVNNCLMKCKLKEIDYAFDNPQYFNLSQHYFKYKDIIKKSNVYKFIKKMPKGAVLHIHDMAILGPDYMLNITYMDNLYACFGDNIIRSFLFSNKLPKTQCNGKWQLLSEARRLSKNVSELNQNIRKMFTMVVDDPDKTYPTITDTWNTFMGYFGHVIGLVTYRPVWEKYFYDALKSFREDNVMYVEVRSLLPSLYELDGTVYNQIITAKAYRKAINRFVTDYPDFIGAKIIFAPSRKVSTNVLTDYLKTARDIKKDMPDNFAGFDLVGEEDAGNPLLDFVPELKEVKDLNFFFHAGETDWFGLPTDENLIDAILLGAKRIGHAYALAKHPILLREVINNDIGIEVNVLSNSILSLVKDVRNHPLSIFLSLNLPVVLSSDDPGAWEATPLTDDFYVAFMGVACRHSDLKILKTLALNSLKYSALDHVKKQRAVNEFHVRWNSFIDSYVCDLGNPCASYFRE